MMVRAGAGLSDLLSRFAWSGRGVAAIEFALIAPLLLSIYFMTLEVSQGIETNKKISRVASMVGDLVTQQEKASPADLRAVMQIGEAVLQPYNRSDPTIEVTAIQVTDEEVPKVKVVWSRRMSGGTDGPGVAEGSVTTVPETLEIKGSFLIRVTASMHYIPVVVWTAEQKTSLGLAAILDDINMREVYYLRPRVSSEIPCDDC